MDWCLVPNTESRQPDQHSILICACVCVSEGFGRGRENESKSNGVCTMCTHPSSPLSQLSQHTSAYSMGQRATIDDLSPSFLSFFLPSFSPWLLRAGGLCPWQSLLPGNTIFGLISDKQHIVGSTTFFPINIYQRDNQVDRDMGLSLNWLIPKMENWWTSQSMWEMTLNTNWATFPTIYILIFHHVNKLFLPLHI